ncbi:MAG TPA: hypothetical protein VMG34_11800 [Bacteroidota bacterium]|nr:hypothetical protein [Bacteroidota bacterium]
MAFLLLAASLLGYGCKKSNPVDNSQIDSKLVGAWYNRSDSVGFEILTDGTLKNLDIDSAGILRYAAVDTINGALLLKLESAKNGGLTMQGTYISRKIDSTYVATGTYSLSADLNTLTLTLILPLNGSSQQTFVYVRSVVGTKVVEMEGFNEDELRQFRIAAGKESGIRSRGFLNSVSNA